MSLWIASLLLPALAFGQATVSSDQPGYLPGQTAIIAGHGFQTGEAVAVSITENPDDGDGPHNFTETADSAGNFTLPFAIDITDIGVTFTVTATGQTSSLIATTTFTDDSLNVAAGGPAGTTFNIAATQFHDSNCSGNATLLSPANPVTASGEPISVPNNGSVKLVASAASVQDGAFNTWSSATGTFTPNPPGTSLTICVNGGQGNNKVYVANFDAPRTTTTTISPTSATTTLGGTASFTVTVTDTSTGTAVTPAGTIHFTDSDTSDQFSSCTLAQGANPTGTAQCTTTVTAANPTGPHTISANFPGADNVHAPSTSGNATLTVNPVCTTPSITMNPANQLVLVNQSATFTAAASGTSPSVQWQVSVNGGAFTNILSATSTTLTITPTGAAGFNGNKYQAVFTNACGMATTNPATLTVNPRTTSTTISLNPATVPVGGTAQVTVTVTDTASGTASLPGGSITFTDSIDTFTPCTLSGSGGVATCMSTVTAAAPLSAHNVSANYAASDNVHSGSISVATPLNVTARATTTAISVSPASTPVGGTAQVTVTVTDAASGAAVTPAGTIALSATSSPANTDALGTCALSPQSAGVASCTAMVTASAPIAIHSINASYTPSDSIHSGSSTTTSAALNVTARTTTTTITVAPASTPVGGTAQVTVIVTDTAVSGTAVTPAGTVGLTSSSSPSNTDSFATCTLNQQTSGVASCVATITTTIPVSVHTLKASYTPTDGIHSESDNTTPLTVTPNYTITVTPLTTATLAGTSATYTVTLTLLAGTGAPVTLSGINLPSGASAAFNQNPATPTTAGSSVTLTVSGTTAVGSFANLAVSGTSANGNQSSAAFTLQVFDYTVSVTLSDVTVIRGATASYTVQVAPVAGSAGSPTSVTLSVSGYPTDSTPSLASSVPLSGSTPLNILPGATSLNDFALTVTAAVPQGSRTGSANLHIYDFTISFTPADQTILRGDSASYTATMTLVPGSSTSGLPASVGLTLTNTPDNSTLTLPANPPFSATPPPVNFSISTAAGTKLGDFQLGLTASVPGGSHTANGFARVFDYTITLSSDETVLRGATANYTVSVNLASGSTVTSLPSSVTLALTGQPGDSTQTMAGAAAFPTSSTPVTTPLVIVTAAPPGGSLGDPTLTVTANIQNSTPATTPSTRAGTAKLHIYDFTITVTANSTNSTLAGCGATYSVNLPLATGSSSTGLPSINLSSAFSGTAPGGITATFSSAAISPGGNSTLTLNVAASASLGTFSFQVTGADSRPEGGTRVSGNATIGTYDYTISLSPNPMVLAQGQPGSFTVNVTLKPGSATPPPVTLSAALSDSSLKGMFTSPTTTVPSSTISVTPALAPGITVFLTTSAANAAEHYTAAVTGDDGYSCQQRTGQADVNVLAISVSSMMRDSNCDALRSTFDVVFTSGGAKSTSATLQATNPGGFMYTAVIKNLGTAADALGLTINLPGDTPGAATGSFALWGSNPVQVFSSDPCAPGAQEITPSNITILDNIGANQSQPLKTNSTLVSSTGSITIPPIPSIAPGGQVWVQVHIRSALLGNSGYPQNSATSYVQGYRFDSFLTVGTQSLSNPVETSFTGTGKQFTGVGGMAIDIDGVAKGGLNAVVTPTPSGAICGAGLSDTTGTPTEPDFGFYAIQLPAGTAGYITLFNATCQQIGQQSFSAIPSDNFVEVDFTNLNPADPVIRGIVGTAGGGVAGAQVTLIGSGNRVLSQTTTSAGGLYLFRFTQPGTYTVQITPPAGYSASPAQQSIKIRQFQDLEVDFLLSK